MKELTQMVVVLTLICAVCGFALSGLRDSTAERIQTQILLNVQGPKVKQVLEGSENDLIQDRRTLMVKGQPLTVFVGKKGGKPWAVAFEAAGKGFGGAISVMTGYRLDSNALTGIQVVSHKETPGIGSRVTEPLFTDQFKGLDLPMVLPPGQCPKGIDAISGATYSTGGVCAAIATSLPIYTEVKKQVVGP